MRSGAAYRLKGSRFVRRVDRLRWSLLGLSDEEPADALGLKLRTMQRNTTGANAIASKARSARQRICQRACEMW